MHLLFGLLCGVIGVIPLAIKTEFEKAVGVGLAAILLLSLIFYEACPTTAWPLFGLMGFFILILWGISALIISSEHDEHGYWVFPGGLLVLYLGITLINSEMLNASQYAALIGTMEERTWTQDIQPKNPHHMRMGSHENAIYLAKKVLGTAGAIGSQFQVDDDHMTLQMIHGELWYVAPLDFSGFGSYSNTIGTPGYVKVHAEDPSRQAELVKTANPFVYTPGAYFGHNLERLIWNYTTSYGIAEIQFEIDEEDQPWWVVSLFKPTIGWSGEKISKVLLISPYNGGVNEYSLEGKTTILDSNATPATLTQKNTNQVPDFVDRVIPKAYVEKYSRWWGLYQQGWWNSCWAGNNLTVPEEANLIYGSEGCPDWVTDITSTNHKDESLVGVLYTNSHTGKAIFYRTKGGSTDPAVLSAVDRHPDVQYKHLHGIAPQLYNVYGTMAAIVPLLNDNHAFQGVALVDILNLQNIAIGKNQFEAMEGYQKLIARSGQQIAMDASHSLQKLMGNVDRINSEVIGGNTSYYLHLEGVPHIFSGASTDFHKLSLTQHGDKVQLEYYASGEDIQPLHGFDNTSLPLEATAAQKEVWQTATDAKTNQENKIAEKSDDELLKSLTPEKLHELLKVLREEGKK